MNSYSAKLPDGSSIGIDIDERVFQPTLTSDLCIKAFWKRHKIIGRVLDLGCGSGIVGFAAARSGLVIAPLCASDISELSVQLTMTNAARLGVNVDCRAGSLFEPWNGEFFDSIINDVSGITEEVAVLSPWFANNIPCASGHDGTDLTRAVIQQSARYLRPSGTLFFPVISLSNEGRIVEEAKRFFRSVEMVANQSWRLPDEFAPHINTFRRLKAESRIDFQEMFGALYCSTRIFAASLPAESSLASE